MKKQILTWLTVLAMVLSLGSSVAGATGTEELVKDTEKTDAVILNEEALDESTQANSPEGMVYIRHVYMVFVFDSSSHSQSVVQESFVAPPIPASSFNLNKFPEDYLMPLSPSGKHYQWEFTYGQSDFDPTKDSTLQIIYVPTERHDYGDWITIVPATCTEKGLAKHICSVCQDEETIEITGFHSFTEFVVDKKPTCTEDGSEKRICSLCQMEETRPINSFGGHAYSDKFIVDKEATCTEEGIKSIHCTACKEIKDSQTIPSKGHIESEWIVDQKATSIEEGISHKECIVCKEIMKTDTIAKLPPEETTLEATTVDSSKSDNPKTGDAFSTIPYISGFLALGVIVLTIFLQKRLSAH